MLIQSGGGKVYAVLANNAAFELSLMPQLLLQSTSVFLAVRCRYKALIENYFDPMKCPKQVLCGGIERSENTLRGTVMLNTGFTLDKIGAGFPTIVAEKLYHAADGFLLGLPGDEDAVLFDSNKRSDFVQDFAQLVLSAIAPVYPAKNFTHVPTLTNAFDLQIHAAKAETPASPFAALPGGKATEAPDLVTKVILGGDDEPVLTSAEQAEQEKVDKPATGGEVSAKVHIFGSTTPPFKDTKEPVADPTF